MVSSSLPPAGALAGDTAQLHTPAPDDTGLTQLFTGGCAWSPKGFAHRRKCRHLALATSEQAFTHEKHGRQF